jgi:alpha-ketoglutarate-dependent taurine dioxygenase
LCDAETALVARRCGRRRSATCRSYSSSVSADDPAELRETHFVVTITPTAGGFGAYVDGVDRAGPPDDEVRAVLQAAIDEHLVLIIRGGQPVATDAQVVAFCSAFGPLRPSLADKSRMPDHPAINLVANRTVGTVQGSGGSAALHFHSDLHQEPPLIEFIYLDAVQVPSAGGATLWVDLRAAYDALSDERKAQVEPLTVQYSLRADLDLDTYFKASSSALATRKNSTVVSLVQANARTGRKSVWPNAGPQSNHRAQVVGMDPDESERLLTELFDHCTQDRFRLRHRWQPGDACLWHNLQTLHGRDAFSDQEVRIMRHVNILGITDPHQIS